MNIFNIPIVLITKQYMEFIHETRELDYDRAGSYLAMAAELIEIKSKWLIPALQNRLNEEATTLDEMSEDDPRKPLAEKLLEFEALKEAAEQLESIPMLGRDAFPSGECKRRADEIAALPIPVKGNVLDLALALERSLIRFAEKDKAPRVKVRSQKITIHSRMLSLKERFKNIPDCMLTDLFVECNDRYELIVTLMAILELVKGEQLNVAQEYLFAPMKITTGVRFGEEISEVEEEAKASKDAAAKNSDTTEVA